MEPRAAFDAQLTGTCDESIPPPLYDPLAAGAMVGELLTLYRDAGRADVERARSRFFEIVQALGLETGWRGQVGFSGEICPRAARLADLVILGGRNSPAATHAPDVADVLLGGGRPVLMTPPTHLAQFDRARVNEAFSGYSTRQDTRCSGERLSLD